MNHDFILFIILPVIIVLTGLTIIGIVLKIKAKKHYKELLQLIGDKMNLAVKKNFIEGTYKNNHISGKILPGSKKKFFLLKLTKITSQEYNLSISRKNILSNIPGILLKTNHKEFDKKFLIESNDVKRTTAVLNSYLLEKIIRLNNELYSFHIYDRSFEAKIELTFYSNILNFTEKLNDILNSIYSEKKTESLLVRNIENEKNQQIRVKNMLALIPPINPDSYKQFFLKFQKDKNIDIAVLSCIALKEAGKKRLVDIINQSIAVNISIVILKKMIKYFAEYKVEESLSWVLKFLFHDDPDLQLTIIDSLAFIGNISIVEILMQLTKGSYSDEIKKHAMDTIYYLQKEVPENEEGNLSIEELNQEGDLYIYDTDNEKGDLSLDNE